ncbi:MAG TPA: hypothetical protein VH117_10515 [Edaphobacter sp.]|jgi:hypothetical protein|nr:hypothetical protein [Edaphobacter sp.]
MSGKKPKAKQEPESTKTPRKMGFDENPNRLRPAWRIGSMEMCDPFGWHEIDGALLLYIRQKLSNFETMTLNEILGAKSHRVAVESLCKDARDRLDDLGLDDVEELLSLRLSSTERIWGILEHNIVILLWWDPDHLVCPSLLKFT